MEGERVGCVFKVGAFAGATMGAVTPALRAATPARPARGDAASLRDFTQAVHNEAVGIFVRAYIDCEGVGF